MSDKSYPMYWRTYPEKIYLQSEEGEPYPKGSEITWCEDEINNFDIKYIRFDLVADLVVAVEELKKEYSDSRKAPVVSGGVFKKIKNVFRILADYKAEKGLK